MAQPTLNFATITQAYFSFPNELTLTPDSCRVCLSRRGFFPILFMRLYMLGLSPCLIAISLMKRIAMQEREYGRAMINYELRIP